VLIAFHDVIGNDESARRGWHFNHQQQLNADLLAFIKS
jgi:hypothetical protein